MPRVRQYFDSSHTASSRALTRIAPDAASSDILASCDPRVIDDVLPRRPVASTRALRLERNSTVDAVAIAGEDLAFEPLRNVPAVHSERPRHPKVATLELRAPLGARIGLEKRPHPFENFFVRRTLFLGAIEKQEDGAPRAPAPARAEASCGSSSSGSLASLGMTGCRESGRMTGKESDVASPRTGWPLTLRSG